MTHLIRKNIFSEIEARPIIRQIFSALSYLHNDIHFAHRDIKPDNIALDELGNVKLIDFGLAREILPHPYRLFSIVGTPDYMAPELYLKTGYSETVDCWSVGAVLFEMLCGRPPFSDSEHNPLITAKRVQNWKKHLEFSSGLSVEVLELIRSLICESQDRLGASQTLESNWLACHAEPRFIPPRNQSNFDYVPSREKILEFEVKPQYAGVLETDVFIDFDYCQWPVEAVDQIAQGIFERRQLLVLPDAAMNRAMFWEDGGDGSCDHKGLVDRDVEKPGNFSADQSICQKEDVECKRLEQGLERHESLDEDGTCRAYEQESLAPIADANDLLAIVEEQAPLELSEIFLPESLEERVAPTDSRLPKEEHRPLTSLPSPSASAAENEDELNVTKGPEVPEPLFGVTMAYSLQIPVITHTRMRANPYTCNYRPIELPDLFGSGQFIEPRVQLMPLTSIDIKPRSYLIKKRVGNFLN